MTTVFARNRAGAGVRRPQRRTPTPDDFYIERDKARELSARVEALQKVVADRDATIASQKDQLAALQKQLVRMEAAAVVPANAPQDQPQQQVKRRGRPPKNARHHSF